MCAGRCRRCIWLARFTHKHRTSKSSVRPGGPTEGFLKSTGINNQAITNNFMATITLIKSYRLNTSFSRGNGTNACNRSLDVEDALLNNPAFLKLPVPVATMTTSQ